MISTIVEFKVNDTTYAMSRRAEGNDTGPSIWATHMSDVNVDALPSDAKYAFVRLAWLVAMSGTALSVADPAQRAAIEAYWRANERKADASPTMHTIHPGDVVLEDSRLNSAT